MEARENSRCSNRSMWASRSPTAPGRHSARHPLHPLVRRSDRQDVRRGRADRRTPLPSIPREPIGVVAAVVPWNYPLSMAAWKLGPALAAGNSRGRSSRPSSRRSPALRIAELAVEAGLPAGRAQRDARAIGETAGQALGRHMDVDCVTFTGSTEVGKLFMHYSGESNIKRVGLESAARRPHIVMADCDLDAAAGPPPGASSPTGQVCNAGSRLIVEAPIKDALARAHRQQSARSCSPAIRSIPTPRWAPSSAGADGARARLHRAGQAKARGCRSAASGSRADTGGYFVEPTVFDGVTTACDRAGRDLRPGAGDDHGHGPRRSARDRQRHRSTASPPASGPATSARRRPRRRCAPASSGSTASTAATCRSPFGGFKQSGFGRDKSLHAIDKYTELKATWINIS